MKATEEGGTLRRGQMPRRMDYRGGGRRGRDPEAGGQRPGEGDNDQGREQRPQMGGGSDPEKGDRDPERGTVTQKEGETVTQR
jgi:hypothetical protein